MQKHIALLSYLEISSVTRRISLGTYSLICFLHLIVRFMMEFSPANANTVQLEDELSKDNIHCIEKYNDNPSIIKSMHLMVNIHNHVLAVGSLLFGQRDPGPCI